MVAEVERIVQELSRGIDDDIVARARLDRHVGIVDENLIVAAAGVDPRIRASEVVDHIIAVAGIDRRVISMPILDIIITAVGAD